MGLVLPPRRVSADASGNGRNGAKLRIYNANTTTLSSVFSDAALTVPLTNPVVADSSGVFPPIYAAEGALFDLTEQTSAGVTIRSEDDVPAVGVSSGAFERDFTTSRVKISGSAGVTSVEAGDPTGDDVGGDLRLGGWAGTAADTVEIESTATTITGTLAVTGAVTTTGTVNTGSTITENSKKLPGIVQTAATTFTAAATVNIELVNTPANCRQWEIELFDLATSTGLDLRIRISYDNGATFKSGASDYAYHVFGAAGAAITHSASTAATYMLLNPAGANMSHPSGKPGTATIIVTTPVSGSNATQIKGSHHAYDAGGTPTPLVNSLVGYGLGSYGRATHIQLLTSTGTITGAYRVIPRRGFGE